MNDKPWYLSKMIWFNALTTASGVIAVLSDSPLVADHPQIVAGLMALAGVINIGLRFLTVLPLEGMDK